VLRGGDGVIFDNTMIRESSAVFLTNEVCPSGGSSPLPGQISDSYIWANDWTAPPGYPDIRINVPDACTPYIKEGRDYYQFARPDYQPYPWPHPLRGE
jgi:hypothetical protein